MPKGGKRPGSGRKLGVSQATLIKRKFQDYFTEEEVIALIADVKKQAKTKPELLKLIVEQLFGKAPQRVEVGGDKNNPIVVEVSEVIARKRASEPRTTADMPGIEHATKAWDY